MSATIERDNTPASSDDENKKNGKEEEEFEVEQILDTKMSGKKRQFKVRWKNYGPERDTWEPEDSLKDGAEESMKEFMIKYDAEKKSKKSKSRKHSPAASSSKPTRFRRSPIKDADNEDETEGIEKKKSIKPFSFESSGSDDEFFDASDAVVEPVVEDGESGADAEDGESGADAEDGVGDSSSLYDSDGFEYLQIVLLSDGESPIGIRCHEGPEKLFIVAVTPGSAAEEAELKPGDRVLAIDGMVVVGINSMVVMLTDKSKQNGYVIFSLERAVTKAAVISVEKVLDEILKIQTPSQNERKRKQMVDICLNSSNELDNDVQEKENFEPVAKKKRGRAADYVKKEEVSSLAEVKLKASQCCLKFGKTVNLTSYFSCTYPGCPYKWKAMVTENANYQIVETKDNHQHGTMERKDGVSVKIKEIITARINGNEAVNAEAVRKRDFPNISAMRQTVSETGRNTPGRPRKHTAALLKE